MSEDAKKIVSIIKEWRDENRQLANEFDESGLDNQPEISKWIVLDDLLEEIKKEIKE